MSLPESHVTTKFSYADYLTWPDDERFELIDGVPFNMTPAPTPKHQDILVQLVTLFNNYLRERSCKVFAAPFDVRLFAEDKQDDDVHHVVQPDLTVICDTSKIDDKGLKGSPDLVVEILSKSTAKKDKTIKKDLYEEAKIKEYWIVDPNNEYIEVYLLSGQNKYGQGDIFGREDRIKTSIFEDFEFELSAIFTE